MNKFVNFLFPSEGYKAGSSFFLLLMRVLFGVLLMTHGYQKLIAFEQLSAVFPDPLGVGSHVSLGLAIFAEFFCALGFVFGAFYRLAMIPMIFTMMVAFFIIHASDPFAVKELAFVYLVVYILMYVTGPGKFSLDYLVAIRLAKDKSSTDKSV